MAQVSITTGELMNAFQALNSLGGQKFPAKCSYTIARLVAKLKGEFDIAEAKRVELVKEFGTEQEDGGVIVAPGDAMNNFLAKWNEIIGLEIQVDAPLLNIDGFGDFSVEPALLAIIDKFIEA